MNLQDKKLSNLLQLIFAKYPDIIFKESERSYWDPRRQTIFYNLNAKDPIWSIFHELGHMQAGHKSYKTDLALLLMESEAWEEAKTIAKQFNRMIDQDHIEDCLDTYREWLHRRSRCPNCRQTGTQTTGLTYKCLNCSVSWQVSASRFRRCYRKKLKTPV